MAISSAIARSERSLNFIANRAWRRSSAEVVFTEISRVTVSGLPRRKGDKALATCEMLASQQWEGGGAGGRGLVRMPEQQRENDKHRALLGKV